MARNTKVLTAAQANASGTQTPAAQVGVSLKKVEESVVVQALSGTVVGANLTFEASPVGEGDTTWVPLAGTRSATGANLESVSGVLTAPPAYGWVFNVKGFQRFRVRQHAYTSGAGLEIMVKSR